MRPGKTPSYKINANGCWVWTGSTGGIGYGVLSINGKPEYVHRLAYRLLKGGVQRYKFVLHRCDNPPCFNPEHLFLGTALDNVKDMIKKGRAVRPPLKFSDETIAAIRKDHAEGMTRRELVALYSISIAHLQRVTKNQVRILNEAK